MDEKAAELVHLNLVQARRWSYLVALVATVVVFILILIFYPFFNPEPLPVWIPMIPALVIGGGFTYIGHWILATRFVPGISKMVHGETIKYEGLTKETTLHIEQTGNLELDLEIKSFAEARSMAQYFLSVAVFILLIIGAYILWS